MNDRDRDLPPGAGTAVAGVGVDRTRHRRATAQTEPAANGSRTGSPELDRGWCSWLLLRRSWRFSSASKIPATRGRRPFRTVIVVHETGTNVILVLREGGEPIYIATEASNDRVGE